jgi:DNA gyrase inhibitor GyrI
MNQLRARLESAVQSSGNRQNLLQADICEEGDLELVYIRIIGQYGEKEPYETAWSNLIRFLENNQAFTNETRFIGISFDDPHVTLPKQCRYYACASVQKKIFPKGEFGTIQLQRGKYAVYTLKGSYSGLQEIYNNMSINFPYTLRHAMTFEEYLNSPRNTKTENLLTKIFIPIK